MMGTELMVKTWVALKSSTYYSVSFSQSCSFSTTLSNSILDQVIVIVQKLSLVPIEFDGCSISTLHIWQGSHNRFHILVTGKCSKMQLSPSVHCKNSR